METPKFHHFLFNNLNVSFMQNDKKWVCIEISLQVTDIRVWAALTDPKLTQRYTYNCQLHSSGEVGSDALWKEEKSDGTFTTHVRAKVLEFTPHTQNFDF